MNWKGLIFDKCFWVKFGRTVLKNSAVPFSEFQVPGWRDWRQSGEKALAGAERKLPSYWEAFVADRAKIKERSLFFFSFFHSMGVQFPPHINTMQWRTGEKYKITWHSLVQSNTSPFLWFIYDPPVFRFQDFSPAPGFQGQCSWFPLLFLPQSLGTALALPGRSHLLCGVTAL